MLLGSKPRTWKQALVSFQESTAATLCQRMVGALIKRMASENPSWGIERMPEELKPS